MKLKHPDTGRIVHVSRTGYDVLKARGYTDPDDKPARPAPGGRPAQSDPKASWVQYARSQGVEDPDELTKAELIDLLGEED